MTESNPNRTCGTCAACCTVLGIAELRKHAGQACRHLDGRDPTRRCSIYARRPKACAEYVCAWRQGLFEEDFSPQRVGFVATAYEQGWTLMVFDAKLAGGLVGGHVKTAVQRILDGPQHDVRIVYLETGLVVFMTDGKIYQGKMMRAKNHENLDFACDDTPVGRYEMRKPEEVAP